jgi:branched-chain amino acid transport system substrate-binding protein
MHARLTASLLILVTCLGCRRDTDPVTLGAAGPWGTSFGSDAKQGIEMAVAEINAAGGIHGRPLRVIEKDDGGNGTTAVAVAESFAADRSVIGVIGHLNSAAMLAAARIYDGHLAVVSPTASTPYLTGISRWVFRIISSDSVTGADMARFANRLGRRRAAILYENDAYGRQLARAFHRSFTGEMVSADPIDPATTSFEPYISAMRQRDPDLVFVAGTDAAGIQLLREARRQNFHADFAGGDGWTGVSADTVASEGVYVSTPFTVADTRPAAREFIAAYRNRYGVLPNPDAALAYDATKLMAAAAAGGGATRAGVRQYLASLDSAHPFTGVIGPVHFDGNGDPVDRSLVITRIHKGVLVVAGSGA